MGDCHGHLNTLAGYVLRHNPPGPGTFRTGSKTGVIGPRLVLSSLCVIVTR